MQPHSILVVTGMAFEARLIAKMGVPVVFAADEVLLRRRLTMLMEKHTYSRLLSFGTAGALDANLSVGQIVLAQQLVTNESAVPTDEKWNASFQQAFASMSLSVCYADLLSTAQAVHAVQAKQRLFESSGAVAVDMESHVLAEFAQCYAIPFAVCRVILDRADQAIPLFALEGLTPEGRTRVTPILLGLLKQPNQLGALLRLAYQTHLAQRQLNDLVQHACFQNALLNAY